MDVIRRLAARVGAWPWREVVREVVGLAGLGLIVAGVWGLGGWEWGAIVAGLPVGGFYVLGELRSLRPREED
jgi:hypothetical protein